MFVGYGYPEHADAVLVELVNLRNRENLSRDELDLEDSSSYTCLWSLKIVNEYKVEDKSAQIYYLSHSVIVPRDKLL